MIQVRSLASVFVIEEFLKIILSIYLYYLSIAYLEYKLSARNTEFLEMHNNESTKLGLYDSTEVTGQISY